jgi:hypothetical protein
MKGISKDIEFYRETTLKLQEEKTYLQQKFNVLEEQLRTQNKDTGIMEYKKQYLARYQWPKHYAIGSRKAICRIDSVIV